MTLYGHAITRGNAKVSIAPSQSPVVWLPRAPAVGGGGSGVADFSASTLGQYLRTHEDTSGVPKCKGLVRPVFEVKASQPNGAAGGTWHLEPGCPPGKSALWLFSLKKIEVPAGGFVLCISWLKVIAVGMCPEGSCLPSHIARHGVCDQPRNHSRWHVS